MLRSLNAVTKETPVVSRYLGRASPDPWFGPQVELSSRDAGSLLDFLRIGKALPSQRIAAEEAPPALLQIEPARSGGNEDLVDARMLFQPGACLQAVVTTEIIGDDEDVAFGIVGFDVGEQGDVPFGVARSGAAGQFLAIAHPQCPVDPGFLGATRHASNGALMRCPLGDQPAAGSKVRGTTGPSSSVQTVVEPSGGSL